jgi:hypothetical protein
MNEYMTLLVASILTAALSYAFVRFVDKQPHQQALRVFFIVLASGLVCSTALNLYKNRQHDEILTEPFEA